MNLTAGNIYYVTRHLRLDTQGWRIMTPDEEENFLDGQDIMAGSAIQLSHLYWADGPDGVDPSCGINFIMFEPGKKDWKVSGPEFSSGDLGALLESKVIILHPRLTQEEFVKFPHKIRGPEDLGNE